MRRLTYKFINKVLNGGAFTDTKTYRYRPYRDRVFKDGRYVRQTYVFRLPLSDLSTIRALGQWETVFFLEEKI